MWLQGQKLQDAYQDYIINYSKEKGLEERSVRNKKHALDGLLAFLDGKPLTIETCRAYALYKFDNGWKKPSSRGSIIKYLRAFINFLYDREYLEKNFAKKLVMPKVVRPPLKLVSEEIAERIIIAGTTPGVGDIQFVN